MTSRPVTTCVAISNLYISGRQINASLNKIKLLTLCLNVLDIRDYQDNNADMMVRDFLRENMVFPEHMIKTGKLMPNWERPYKVMEISRLSTYNLWASTCSKFRRRYPHTYLYIKSFIFAGSIVVRSRVLKVHDNKRVRSLSIKPSNRACSSGVIHDLVFRSPNT